MLLNEHCWPLAMLDVDVMLTGLMTVEMRPMVLLLADDGLTHSSSININNINE
jgi:hypothetical protein